MSQPAARPRSCFALLGFAGVAVVCAVLIVWWPIASAIRSFERALQIEQVVRGGEAFQVAVSRTIEREWASLLAVASQADVNNLEEVRDFVDAVPRAGGRVAWAGYADQSGIIVAGSERRREGESVLERRWFVEGMTRGGVGNVYTPTSASGRAETGDLVNMSVPIRDGRGEPRGVLVYSLRLSWLAAFAQQVSNELDVDIFVLGRDGSVLFQRVGPGQPPLSEDLRSAAMTFLTPTGSTERAAGSHVFAVLPDLVSGDLPHFGWRLLVRLPSRVTGWHLDQLNHTLWMACLLLASALLLLAVLFAKLFLAPMRRLVVAAKAIAGGADVYPPEVGISQEAAELSQALALIQGRLHEPPAVDTPLDLKLAA